jgi:hypothetical protein
MGALRLSWLGALSIFLAGCAQGSTAGDEPDESGGGAAGTPTAHAGGSGAQGATGAGGAPSPDCGNGILDPDEECDGAEVGSYDCSVVGHDHGQLGCTGGCLFDTSDCHTCGDVALDGPELCDGGELDGQDCSDLGHDGGTLLCAADCLSFDESSCTDCGDGVAAGAEECDAPDLGGEECWSLGFAGGGLACFSDCTFNTQGCFSGQCSNGVDDDGDGFTDSADPGCTSPSDDDEAIFANSCGGLGAPIYDVTFADTNLPVRVTGSTLGAPNHFGPLGLDPGSDCTTASGGEVILFYRAFTSWSPALFTLDNIGTNYDTVLYIRQNDCVSPSAEICDDDGGWLYSVLFSELYPVTLPPGDYFIFIDGFAGAAGDFELIIDLYP